MYFAMVHLFYVIMYTIAVKPSKHLTWTKNPQKWFLIFAIDFDFHFQKTIA